MKYDTIFCGIQFFLSKISVFQMNAYITSYEAIENNLNEKGNAYPEYYHNIQHCPAMWFKIPDMKPLKYDTLISNFFGSSSGGDTSQYSTLCDLHFLLNQPKILNFKEDNWNGIY